MPIKVFCLQHTNIKLLYTCGALSVWCTSLCIRFCLRRPFPIIHLWGFMMLLLKAAVNVGSELQASSYSLKTNTETCGRFIFSELYIFFPFLWISFWEWRYFAFWLEQRCPVMWANIEFIVDIENLGVAIPWVPENAFQGNLTVFVSLAAFHPFGFVKIRGSQSFRGENQSRFPSQSVCCALT